MSVMFTDTKPTDYAKVVEVIRAMKPENVTSDQFGDVITLLEWLQKQVLEQVDKLSLERTSLQARATALKEAQKRTQAQLRAAHAVMHTGHSTSIIAKLLGR
jgi:beta-N-acetylglucosaminidase